MDKLFLCENNTGLSIIAEKLYNYFFGDGKAKSAALNVQAILFNSPDQIIIKSMNELGFDLSGFKVSRLNQSLISESCQYIIVDNSLIPSCLENKKVIRWGFVYSAEMRLEEIAIIRNTIARWIQNL